MSATLALELLYEYACVTLPAVAPGISVVFGHREIVRQINQGLGCANRVVFDPFDTVSTDDPARGLGQNPRSVASLGEGFAIYLWTYDASSPEKELVQWRAARVLYDKVRLMLYLAAGDGTIGTPIGVKSVGWVPQRERGLGCEMRLVCTIGAKIADEDTICALLDAAALRYREGTADESILTILRAEE
jgi:hypothetical protein